MKGAKGGKRDRLISWLFSRKNQEQKTKEIEEEKISLNSKIKTTEIKVEKENKKPTPLIQEELIKKEKNNTTTITKINVKETRKTIFDDNSNSLEDFVKVEITDKLENNIEKEIKEPTNLIEFAIIEEIEKMVKDDYYEIEEIKYELKVLTQQEEDEVLYEEVEEIQIRLEELIKKFEEIKKRYEYIYSTINFDQVNEIQDDYISSLLSDYKENIKNNKQIEDFVKEVKYIEEYINIINTIVEIEKDKDTLSDKIEDKLQDYEFRDIEFEQLKEQYTDVEKINLLLDSFNKEQESIIKDLDDKVNETIKIKNEISKTTKLIPNFNKLFQAALMINASKKIPPTPLGTVLKANIIINAINIASTFIERKEVVKTTKTIKYTNYEKDINKAMYTLNDTIINIGNTLLDVKDMKKTFKKNFSEFSNQIPEYEEMMKNLEDIEKELTRKETTIIKYNNEFSNILENNNKKVKKIEDELV